MREDEDFATGRDGGLDKASNSILSMLVCILALAPQNQAGRTIRFAKIEAEIRI